MCLYIYIFIYVYINICTWIHIVYTCMHVFYAFYAWGDYFPQYTCLLTLMHASCDSLNVSYSSFFVGFLRGFLICLIFTSNKVNYHVILRPFSMLDLEECFSVTETVTVTMTVTVTSVSGCCSCTSAVSPSGSILVLSCYTFHAGFCKVSVAAKKGFRARGGNGSLPD